MKSTMSGRAIQGGGAQPVAGTVDISFDPIASHGQYAGGLLASVQSPGKPDGATSIVVQCFTQNVRFTLDGSAPTATRGFRITAAADPMLIPVSANAQIRFIEEAASAVLSYQWGC